MSRSKNTITNFLWRFAERCGAQGVSFIVSLVLARLLSPDDYGTVALMTVFISILSVFIDSGFSAALIQKKDADELDFSSIFYFNLVSCGLMYLILLFAAPLISAFYGRPEMTAMLRVLGITFLISGVKSVQTAYVSKNMMFKRFFFATLGGTIGAAFVGIGMAAMGFGAWAIIAQSLFNNAVDTVILWVTVKWRPKKQFSFQRLKQLFSFGWKLLASLLLDTVYNNLRSLIIGKVYSSEDLAFYNKGQHLPDIIIINVNSSIDSVLLPTMSATQNDREALKSMTRRSIQISTYVMAPLLLGMAACATPLIRLLLTQKWLPCVPYLVIFCVTYTFYPVHTANLNAIKALGRSDLFLKLEIIKKAIGLTVLAITVPISVMAMGYSLLVTCVLSQIINSWPNRKLLNYGYLEQLKDILPGIVLAAFMAVCVYPIQWLGLPDFVTLLIQVPLGAVIFVAGSALLKLEAFTYLWAMVKPAVKKLWKRGRVQ